MKIGLWLGFGLEIESGFWLGLAAMTIELWLGFG